MTNDMDDDKLNALAREPVAEPSAAARQRAMMAAMTAFDAAEAEAAKKTSKAAQGSAWARRLRSIVPTSKGNWIMDMRIPIGTAAIALLLLPLGYQLYTSTAFTPPVLSEAAAPVKDAAPAKPVADAAAKKAESRTETSALSNAVPAVAPAPAAPEPLADAIAVETEAAPQQQAPAAEIASGGAADSAFAPPPPMAAPSSALMRQQSMTSMAVAAPSTLAPVDSGDTFAKFDESPLKVVAQDPVSTFSIDVDTASYSYARSMLNDGYIPEPDAVRIEEMINYFPYDYPAPADADVPFKPTIAIYPTPWNPKTELLQIGIKGYEPPVAEHKLANLVFLFDTSGSMDEPNKLPLLKRAFSLLVENLSAEDTVSIVAYAGSAGVVLEPTRASEKAKIIGALDGLAAGGSTAGGEGIALAYKLAEQSKIANGINRVILATDGDFNVGIDDPEQLKDYIKTKRDSGVFLSVLGFGRGNLDDALMQSLAQNGNGNASYIDSFKEAQKVLVTEGGSTLETIAKDGKIQVEFNPAFVSEYRLVGYETRALKREDFNNDKVDAGDIGAGHTVTALYEITPTGSGAELVEPLRYGGNAAAPPANPGDELGFLKMRYKLPNEDTSRLLEMPIGKNLVLNDIAKASDDQRFAAAVAAFGQKLKGSDYGAMSWDAIRDLAQGARGSDTDGYRAEFVQMVKTAAGLRPDADAAKPVN